MRITAPSSADVSDRAARVLGEVAPRAASVWDTSDRAARDLGKVDIAAFDVPLDVSDRAARDVGQVDSLELAGMAGVVFEAANVTSPGVDTIIVSTGALATAGTYEVRAGFGTIGTVQYMAFEWQDSLNAVKERVLGHAARGGDIRARVVVVANDRFVIACRNGAIAGESGGWICVWRIL